MTDVERMMMIARYISTDGGTPGQKRFCTADLTAKRRRVLGARSRTFSNITVAVNHAVVRGYLRLLTRVSSPRMFALTAKGRRFAAGL